MLISSAQIRRVAVEIGVFSFFVNALMLVIPLYMLQVYDRVIPSSSLETLVFLTILAAAALGLLAVLEVVRGIYANRIAARLDVSQGRRAMLAAMDMPRAAMGDIQAMRDLAAVRTFIASRTMFALFDLPFAPLFIALLWLIHPLLFALAAGGALLLTGIAIANQMATANAARTATESGIGAMMTAQSFVRNAEALRAMGMIENAVSVWGRQHARTLAASDEAARINSLFVGLSRYLRLGLQIAVLGAGAWLVLQGEMTAGMIFASSLISGRGLQPIDQVIGGWRQFVEIRAAWRRFRTAVSSREEQGEYTALPDPKGRLDVENLVYFPPNAKPQAEPVLKQIGFRVPQGSTVGIIGPSGAGKSTLVRLIVGAIRQRAGIIRIDGSDIRSWPSDSLGRHVGYLPQEVELLPGTIAQNIARFSPEAKPEAIIEAARRAQVHDLVLSMPDGYDTLIGPQGLVLSGGQRQRIGLARAFFGNPCLLVLDEPNANLDSEGDAALERAIDDAHAAGATVLIVTQRMSVVHKVERLLVLRAGVIEDFGPRDEVIARLQQKVSAGEPAGQGSAVRLSSVGKAANDGAPPAPKSPFAAFGPGMKPIAKAAGDKGRTKQP